MNVSRRAVLTGSASGLAVAGAGWLSGEVAADSTQPHTGRLREYWLQVDHVRRDAAPHKYDPMMGMPITQRTVFDGLVYRAFTPGWRQPLPGSAKLGPNTGFPGPVIRARVGDRIRVHLQNNDTFYKKPHSIHPHGVRYRPDSCGAWTATNTEPGSAVKPGEQYTYEWDVPESSVGTWPYHDHSEPFNAGAPSENSSGGDMSMGSQKTMEVGAQLGLMGHIVIEPHDAPHFDREFYLVFHDLYADDVAGLDGDIDCFNGRAFLGNTPTFRARVGQRVRWHIITLGTEFHVFHLHGHRWESPAGRYVDSEVVGPSTSLVVDYTEDNPGDWLYHCHVVDHMTGGMVGNYLVTA